MGGGGFLDVSASASQQKMASASAQSGGSLLGGNKSFTVPPGSPRFRLPDNFALLALIGVGVFIVLRKVL